MLNAATGQLSVSVVGCQWELLVVTSSSSFVVGGRRPPECGSLEEGIKRDALLTSAMRPSRLRLTLTHPQPGSLAQ